MYFKGYNKIIQYRSLTIPYHLLFEARQNIEYLDFGRIMKTFPATSACEITVCDLGYSLQLLHALYDRTLQKIRMYVALVKDQQCKGWNTTLSKLHYLMTL